MKSRSRPDTLVERLTAEVKELAKEPAERGAAMAENITSMVTSAMKMEPSTIAAYREIVEDWLASVKDKASEIAKIPSK